MSRPSSGPGSGPEQGTALRLGVDVGGTFTDVVVVGGGGPRVAKVPSTPEDQGRGVLAGVDRSEVDLAEVRRFSHGTTVATNTVLERDGARTVLVATRGFADLLVIGRQDRPALYDLTADRPAPLVPRGRVVEAAERLGPGGEVVEALTDAEVARVAQAVVAHEPEAVAVSLLFAFTDGDHERRLAEAVTERLGEDVPVTRSSALLPVFREFERTSTTVMNAYVAPRMRRYLASLGRRLRDRGLRPPVEVMRSGGGTFAAPLAARDPVHTLLSGPAGGAWGAAAVGRAAGLDRVVALDMGGTSTDVTMIADGRPRTTGEGAIDRLPFAVSTTDIHTVGAGGGSIAWLDAGGSLRVGPASAGAVPGPACYGRGGQAPTVTDANLVLGRLDARTRLGGELELDEEAAGAALARLGARAGRNAVEAATGVLRVVEAQMAKALRVVSVERGHDPREFALVAFGGAGPLHQAALARELGTTPVLVPPSAGVLSALGLLTAPTVVEEARTRLVRADEVNGRWLTGALAELEDTAHGRFTEQHTGVETVRCSVDLRYRGQAFELAVDVDPAAPGVDRLVADFHHRHRERYGWAEPDEPVEIVTLRVRLEGPTPDLPLPPLPAGEGAAGAIVREQEIVVDGRRRACPVYDRSLLGARDAFAGPALVVGPDATCFVAAWQRAEVDGRGTLVLEPAP